MSRNQGDLFLFYAVLAFCVAIATGLISLRHPFNHYHHMHNAGSAPPADATNEAGGGR